MITGRQIRAARGLLRWRVEDLAIATGLTREAITRIEDDQVQPRATSLSKIQEAFEKESIEFLDQSGVRKKDDTLRVIEGAEAYLQLLDDVYYTLKDGGEVLFAYVCNRISSKPVIESQLRMRRTGIKFRSLISDEDNYCLYPLQEYRQIPQAFFENNPQIIFGNKVGSMIDNNRKALIVNNASFAETQRRIFNLIWSLQKPPQKSTATETYE